MQSIREISIPDSVTSIGDSAFRYCKSLQEIIIPNSVKKIGTNPFEKCKCKVICNSPHYRVVGDVLYDADMTVLISFLSDTTKFAIPSSVTCIVAGAFWGCKSLKEITIPMGVENIGISSFEECNSLQKIKVPKNSKVRFEKLIPWEYEDNLVEV